MDGKGIHFFPHMSASNITGYVQRRSSWFAQRILNKKISVSPAMIRGQAVETGVRFALLGDDIDSAIARALKDYDADIEKEAIIDLDGKVLKEREMIAPSVEIAVGALAQFGKPSYDENGRQHKVSINCRYGDAPDDVIPIIGYLDFVFDDLIIDLKSTGRIPSEMSWAHQIQRAIYHRATGKPVKFCYVSTKKAEFREDGDIPQLLEEIRLTIRAMDRFLKLDEETQWYLALPNPDSFEWTGNETVRKQIFTF